MICPHCNKAIPTKKPVSLKRKVIEYHKQGFSFRDIEALTKRQVSFSTASRWIRESKKEGA